MWVYAILAAAQMVNGFQQAEMIKKNAEINQSVAEMNAEFSDLDAYKANNAGLSEAARYQTVVDSTLAAQKTAMAAQHVDINYGTATDIESDSKITGMINVLEIQRQGREKALGYNVQGINTRLGGVMGKLQGQLDASSAQSRGILNAVSTGISGYDRMESTGRGNTSRSGSNSAPQWRQGTSTMESSKPAWFFGQEPSRYSQPSLSSPEGDHLFS